MRRSLVLLIVFITLPLFTTACIDEDGITINIPLKKQTFSLSGKAVCAAMKTTDEQLSEVDCENGDAGQQLTLTEGKNVNIVLNAITVDIQNQVAQQVPDYATRTITRVGVSNVKITGNNGLGFTFPKATLNIAPAREGQTHDDASKNTLPSGAIAIFTTPPLNNGTLDITENGNSHEKEREATALIKGYQFDVIPAVNGNVPAGTKIPPTGDLKVEIEPTVSVTFNPLKATGIF